ncbi:MAG TPA: phosphoribosylglycinamide formyltransferase [Beijerinckiaceae bacterium]|nr:phosphoribosylglycinamide formyltransferase [Beijerinckiaceae bacterium]
MLISGRGSNMAALIEAAGLADYPAEIVLVLSNKAEAGGLAIAAAAGIATSVIPHKGYKDRESFDRAMTAAIEASGAELVCLAGFMRLLSPWFCRHWHGRLINIHPALLPSFKGLDTHARALAAGVKIHGATVHFVIPEMDEGPIIAQGAVPVLPEDDEPALAARVLGVEHRLYPEALARVATGAARMVEGRCVMAPHGPAQGALMVPSQD